MRYRALDENGDYTFGQNKQNFVLQAEAVAQAVLTKLKLYTGEWWEDLTDGFPLWTHIIGKRNTKEIVDKMVQNRILEVIHVKNIIEYESTWDNSQRAYSFSCRIDTAFGETKLSEVKF